MWTAARPSRADKTRNTTQRFEWVRVYGAAIQTHKSISNAIAPPSWTDETKHFLETMRQRQTATRHVPRTSYAQGIEPGLRATPAQVTISDLHSISEILF